MRQAERPDPFSTHEVSVGMNTSVVKNSIDRITGCAVTTVRTVLRAPG